MNDKKPIILARVSTEEQESNTAQVARLKEFAESKGFLDYTIYEIEESSTKAYRKKFQQILEEIKVTKCRFKGEKINLIKFK